MVGCPRKSPLRRATLGTEKVYDYLDENPAVEFRAVEYVNNPRVIATEPNFVSINATLEVDMVIGADGRKRSHSFHRVLMRSAAKLHYSQAQTAIGGRPDDDVASLVAPVLAPLYAAYAALLRAQAAPAPRTRRRCPGR